MESDPSLRSIFVSARSLRRDLESRPDPTDSTYQEKLQTAIASLEQCRAIADRISLFSPNETEDDISCGDLQYLLIDYYLGELQMKEISQDRSEVLQRAQNAFERYLHLLDTYIILSQKDRELYERYAEDRNEFSLMSSNDAAVRRDTKIARFKQENELKRKLEALIHIPHALQQDDDAVRELYRAEIDLSTHQSFHALDMIAQELQIIALMPHSVSPNPDKMDSDERARQKPNNVGYSDRLDPSISQLSRGGKAGPILNKDGKPLKPFTLLDSRQSLQNGVFKPDHSLPTMTIDEYLAEEKRRGGMIDGGGEQSGRAVEPDEDNLAIADSETMKARDWDEFVEANPKGSGNTINRG